ncbi:MAG: hypothetical protein SF053_11985 [Bacteroidia bacterium]|nr:hypothetical protein [Bacteroidia bacterium]
MRTILCTAALMAGLVLSVRAQPGMTNPQAQDKLGAYKVAFFTNRLALTSREAEVFWPVYNAYDSEMEALRQEVKTKQQSVRSAVMSQNDKEVEKLADDFVALRRREYEITEKYHQEFKRVLPIRKVVMLYQVEQEYKRALLEEIRQRRLENRN